MVRSLLVARCRCGEQGFITPGVELSVANQELQSDGWRYAGDRWRCAKCHVRYVEQVAKRKRVKGEKVVGS